MYERYDSLGVVALMTPWNYPFAIPLVQLATALAAGNVVVLKPSPVTPLVGQKIGELCRRADVPANVVHVVHLRDEDAPALVEHSSVAKVFFTGSVETGRRVMASAAKGPKPVVLELGGKDPAIVAADADLDRAVPGIVWYAMANSGQTCAAVECVYVHRAIAELFTQRLVAEVRRLRVGDPLDPATDVGPLATEEQRRRVEAHVEEAVAMGARVLVGGHRLERPGYFYAPTALTDVPPSARLLHEETFGPVIPVVVVDTLEEAVDLINRSPLGLTASVWTTNSALGRDLAVRLRVGAVHVNDHACHWAEPRAAWGGVRQSGFGRVLGPHGLLEMVAVKIVSEEYRGGALDPWWYPYSPHVISLLANTARALYAPLCRRPWALFSLLLNRRARRRVNWLEYLRHPRTWW
ncbi:MAG: aldehyde dehydrogenase family protein [Ardenticatenia bacterium]|nr:aldehyde dehydrogenase family protein [Ardenticatenia bacterium]